MGLHSSVIARSETRGVPAKYHHPLPRSSSAVTFLRGLQKGFSSTCVARLARRSGQSRNPPAQYLPRPDLFRGVGSPARSHVAALPGNMYTGKSLCLSLLAVSPLRCADESRCAG